MVPCKPHQTSRIWLCLPWGPKITWYHMNLFSAVRMNQEPILSHSKWNWRNYGPGLDSTNVWQFCFATPFRNTTTVTQRAMDQNGDTLVSQGDSWLSIFLSAPWWEPYVFFFAWSIPKKVVPMSHRLRLPSNLGMGRTRGTDPHQALTTRWRRSAAAQPQIVDSWTSWTSWIVPYHLWGYFRLHSWTCADTVAWKDPTSATIWGFGRIKSFRIHIAQQPRSRM